MSAGKRGRETFWLAFILNFALFPFCTGKKGKTKSEANQRGAEIRESMFGCVVGSPFVAASDELNCLFVAVFPLNRSNVISSRRN